MFEGFAEHRINVGDAELYVKVGGTGSPLLLLHGYPQSHVAWHLVTPQLKDDFTLVLPDLRGYGASRGPAPDRDHVNYSKRVMAADMIGLMDALGHRRFAVGGHDRGGRVGYRLCLDHPGRVERFAAIDIIPTLDVWEEMDADKALATYHWQFLALPPPVPETLIGYDPAFYINHLLQRWAGRPDALTEDAVAAYIDQFRDPAVIAATCADYRAGATVDRALDQADRDAGKRIACPVLALWGPLRNRRIVILCEGLVQGGRDGIEADGSTELCRGFAIDDRWSAWAFGPVVGAGLLGAVREAP